LFTPGGFSLRAVHFPIQVSLSTVELRPDGAGTRLLFTKQGVYLDGHPGTGERQRGTEALLTNLERALR
jgi:hypothetical protein